MASETTTEFEAMSSTAIKTGGAIKSLRHSVEELAQALITMQKEIAKNGAVSKETAENINRLRNSVAENAKAQAQADRIYKKVNDDVIKLQKSYRTLGERAKDAARTTLKLTAFLAGTTMSLAKTRDITLKYNQAVYDFARAQKTAGQGIGETKKAFDILSKSTTFSKKEFAAFAVQITNTYKGLAPTTNGIANLAKAIQEQFGPSVEKAIEVSKELMEVQNKFPAMYNQIIQMQNKMSENKASDAEIKTLRARIQLMGNYNNISKKTMMTQLQMITKVSRAEKEQLKTNTSITKMNQRMEDVMLAAGQKMEAATTAIADAFNGLLGAVEKMPSAIIAAGAAMMLFKKMSFGGLIGKGSLGGLGSLGGRGAIRTSIKLFGKDATKAFASGKMLNGLQTVIGKSFSLGFKTLKGSIGAIGRAGARGFAPIAAVTAGIEGFSKYKDMKRQGYTTKQAATGGAIKGGGVFAGALGGAATGAALGSFVPVLGTAIGGLVGGTLGALGGGKLMDILIKKIYKVKEETSRWTELIQVNAKTNENVIFQYQKIKANYEQINKMAKENYEITKQYGDTLAQMGILQNIDIETTLKKPLQQILAMKDASLAIVNNFLKTDNLDLLSQAGLNISPEVAKKIQKQLKINPEVALSSSAWDELEKQISIHMNDISKNKKDLEIQINNTTDEDKKIKLQEKLNQLLTDQASTMAVIKELESSRSTILKSESQYVEASEDQWTKISKMAEKNNAVYEQRLSVQRELMEAAQFGLGASLSMMKKQVDMSYKMMENQQKIMQISDKLVDSNLKDLGFQYKLTKEDKEQLKYASDAIEAKETAIKIVSKGNAEGKLAVGVASELVRYSLAQTEAQGKMMQQQKKIYDLTKDMREGYLQAIREQSTNVGEFSKIIGTQEMGWTQLINVVDSFNEKGASRVLNTLTAGGTGGVQREIRGKYNASGNILDFRGGEENYLYTNGTDGSLIPKKRSTVGSANAMTEEYLGGKKEASTMTKEDLLDTNTKATKNGTVLAFKELGITARAFGQGNRHTTWGAHEKPSDLSVVPNKLAQSNTPNVPSTSATITPTPEPLTTPTKYIPAELMGVAQRVEMVKAKRQKATQEIKEHQTSAPMALPSGILKQQKQKEEKLTAQATKKNKQAKVTKLTDDEKKYLQNEEKLRQDIRKEEIRIKKLKNDAAKDYIVVEMLGNYYTTEFGGPTTFGQSNKAKKTMDAKVKEQMEIDAAEKELAEKRDKYAEAKAKSNRHIKSSKGKEYLQTQREFEQTNVDEASLHVSMFENNKKLKKLRTTYHALNANDEIAPEEKRKQLSENIKEQAQIQVLIKQQESSLSEIKEKKPNLIKKHQNINKEIGITDNFIPNKGTDILGKILHPIKSINPFANKTKNFFQNIRNKSAVDLSFFNGASVPSLQLNRGDLTTVQNNLLNQQVQKKQTQKNKSIVDLALLNGGAHPSLQLNMNDLIAKNSNDALRKLYAQSETQLKDISKKSPEAKVKSTKSEKNPYQEKIDFYKKKVVEYEERNKEFQDTNNPLLKDLYGRDIEETEKKIAKLYSKGKWEKKGIFTGKGTLSPDEWEKKGIFTKPFKKIQTSTESIIAPSKTLSSAHYTSAYDQKYGHLANPETMAYAQSQEAQEAKAFLTGSPTASNEGNNSQVEVVIKYAKNIEAEINTVKNVAVTLEQVSVDKTLV